MRPRSWTGIETRFYAGRDGAPAAALATAAGTLVVK
jgi:hypothetical protein